MPSLPNLLGVGCKSRSSTPVVVLFAPSCSRRCQSSISSFGRGWVCLLVQLFPLHLLYSEPIGSLVPSQGPESAWYCWVEWGCCIHVSHPFLSVCLIVLALLMHLCGCRRWVCCSDFVLVLLCLFQLTAICCREWGWLPCNSKGGGGQRLVKWCLGAWIPCLDQEVSPFVPQVLNQYHSCIFWGLLDLALLLLPRVQIWLLELKMCCRVCPNAKDHVVGLVEVLDWNFVDGLAEVLLWIWQIKR